MILPCFFNNITDNDVDKKITNALLYCKNKCKTLHKPLIGVYIGTCIQAVSKAKNIFG